MRLRHTIDTLFTFLLFSLYVLLLLLMLVFSAKAYKACVDGLSQNQNLRTAQNYISTKIRQHDDSSSVTIGQVEGSEALCLRETIEEKDYITYIFQSGDSLYEVFTSADNTPAAGMGTSIADVKSFSVSENDAGLITISITDCDGYQDQIRVHPGSVSDKREVTGP